MMISTMIPEPLRSYLVEAGQKACMHHHPRTTKDVHGNPDFVVTNEYRSAREELETVIQTITTRHSRLFLSRIEQLALARKFGALRMERMKDKPQ